MNLKDAISYAHYAAMNGSWIFDETSCMAMKVIGPVALNPDERQESRGVYQLRLHHQTLRSFTPDTWRKVDDGGYRVFIVEDLSHEGAFVTVADPWLPHFADGRFLADGPFTLEMEHKLAASLRYERVSSEGWLKAVMALPAELAPRVQDDQRMADCQADYWSVGGIMGSSRGSTLAGWIDLWFGKDFVWTCPDCGSRVFISWGCAGLSIGSLNGICSGCGNHVKDGANPSGKNARALQVLRRHPANKQGKRPYRIDTVLKT